MLLATYFEPIEIGEELLTEFPRKTHESHKLVIINFFNHIYGHIFF